MKVVLATLLVVSAIAGGFNPALYRDIPTSTCYAGVPFKQSISSDQNFIYSLLTGPSFLTLSSNGVMSGTANSSGAYPVSYKVADQSGNTAVKNVVINVANTLDSSSIWATGANSSYYSRQVTNPLSVSVASPASSLSVKNGDPFQISLACANNKSSVVYGFLNLPAGLTGDSKTGIVSGSFSAPGTYTFGVQAADQSGNTAEGYVTVNVQAAQQTTLTKVTINNAVPFVYNLTQIQNQQNEADKQLFKALAAVNAAKSVVSSKQSAYDSLVAQLAAAELAADQAAAAAAAANAARASAKAQLGVTNKALNDAEDQLNLALLYQSGSKDGVAAAQNALDAANAALANAQATLNNANNGVTNAQSAFNSAQLVQTNAVTAYNNAQKDLVRATDDLNEAKNALAKAIDLQEKAKIAFKNAQDAVTVAQQGYDAAKKALDNAGNNSAALIAAKQQALADLAKYTADFQQAQSDLGAADWELSQATAALNVAKAAKEAADRTSAAVVANGVPIAGSSDSSSTDSSSTSTSTCSGSGKIGFAGVGTVTSTDGKSKCTLSTGQNVVAPPCADGQNYLVVGATITIKGVVSPSKNLVEAHHISKAKW